MRKPLFVLLTALLTWNLIPEAKADTIITYTIHFTGSPMPTGSFTYDSTTNQFLNFTVNWNGAAFDFMGSSPYGSANSPSLADGGPSCIAGATGPQATLMMMTVCGSLGPPEDYWDGTCSNLEGEPPPCPASFDFFSSNAEPIPPWIPAATSIGEQT